MRHQKMAEWMENVEKAIARIMADKVYTSAEFKRERDNFHVSTVDLKHPTSLRSNEILRCWIKKCTIILKKGCSIRKSLSIISLNFFKIP